MVVFVVAPARVLATLLAAPLKYINGEISLVRRPVIHHAYAFTVIYAGAPAPPSGGRKKWFSRVGQMYFKSATAVACAFEQRRGRGENASQQLRGRVMQKSMKWKYRF